jgi:HlyD family secretion protein
MTVPVCVESAEIPMTASETPQSISSSLGQPALGGGTPSQAGTASSASSANPPGSSGATGTSGAAGSSVIPGPSAGRVQLEPGKGKSASKPRPPIVLIVILIAALAGAGWYFTRPKVVSAQIHVSGRIEGYETNVGPKIGGRIDFISSREGDEVKKGQPLVKISDDDIQAQLRGARARYKRSQDKAEEATYQIKVVQSQINEARLLLTQSGEDTHAQIDQAEANLAQNAAKLSESRALLTQAQADWELAVLRKKRFAVLAAKGAVSQDEDDQAVTTESTTKALVEAKGSLIVAAKKQLSVAVATLSQARSSRFNPAMKSARLLALQQQLIQAQYSLKSANQDINDAKAEQDQIMANIAYLNVLSPIDGVVTARVVEPGAVVVPGQNLMSLINLDTVYLRGYIPEGVLGRVKVGQKAKVVLDSSPKTPFDGTVIEIDPEGSFTPENIYFKDDRVKQVFGIKIGITRPDRLAKPGMPADAEILTDEPGETNAANTASPGH